MQTLSQREISGLHIKLRVPRRLTRTVFGVMYVQRGSMDLAGANFHYKGSGIEVDSGQTIGTCLLIFLFICA